MLREVSFGAKYAIPEIKKAGGGSLLIYELDIRS